MRRKKCRKYQTPQMEIEEFDIPDIITTSPYTPEDPNAGVIISTDTKPTSLEDD